MRARKSLFVFWKKIPLSRNPIIQTRILCSKQPDFLDNGEIQPTIPTIHGQARRTPSLYIREKRILQQKKEELRASRASGRLYRDGFPERAPVGPRSDPAGSRCGNGTPVPGEPAAAAAAVETGPQGARGNGPGRRSCGNPAGAAPGASDRRAPDLLVALGVGPETCRENKGCIISEQGEPPDFVLEIAARRAGAVDFRMPVEAPGTGDSGPVASAGTWGPSHSENGPRRAIWADLGPGRRRSPATALVPVVGTPDLSNRPSLKAGNGGASTRPIRGPSGESLGLAGGHDLGCRQERGHCWVGEDA